MWQTVDRIEKPVALCWFKLEFVWKGAYSVCRDAAKTSSTVFGGKVRLCWRLPKAEVAEGGGCKDGGGGCKLGEGQK